MFLRKIEKLNKTCHHLTLNWELVIDTVKSFKLTNHTISVLLSNLITGRANAFPGISASPFNTNVLFFNQCRGRGFPPPHHAIFSRLWPDTWPAQSSAGTAWGAGLPEHAGEPGFSCSARRNVSVIPHQSVAADDSKWHYNESGEVERAGYCDVLLLPTLLSAEWERRGTRAWCQEKCPLGNVGESG